MTGYSPASSLGWLDFDPAATERVSTLLRALEEPTTLDVLGLGTIRDAFSNMLHPGTSYIHTRLRYLMFLPWIFQRLEAERVAPGDFFRRLRHDEARLIGCLRHLGPGKGVIGYRAGRNLKRMPSDIYWGGLWEWGLRRLPIDLGGYAQRAAALGRRRAARDDDGNVTDPSRSMWAPLPPPPGDFLQDDIGFGLRRDEAQVLVDNIRRRNPQTLLASLCDRPHLAAERAYPWDVPSDGLPGRVAEVVRHARCFSELTAGPQYAYNLLVARRARRDLGWDTSALEESQRRRLQGWVALVEGRPEQLGPWAAELGAFWDILRGHRIPPRTRTFITEITRAAAGNPRGFENDPTIHEQIRLREIQLKGRRARLGSRSALENWNGGWVGGQLEYRWSIARRYLGEIDAALRTGA